MKYFTKLLWACVLILGLTVSSVSDVGIGTDTPRTGIFPLLDTGIVTTGLGTQFGYDAESAGPYGVTAIAHPTNNEGTVERDSAAAYWDLTTDVLKYARGSRENVWLTSEPTSCTGFTCSNVTVDAFSWPFWIQSPYPTHAATFGDNSTTRFFYQYSTAGALGDWVSLSVYVKMDDGGVPAPGPGNNSAYDFYFSIVGSGLTSGFTVTHIGGNVYLVYGCVKKTLLGNQASGILKVPAQSSRSFKVSGLQLEVLEGPIGPPGDDLILNGDFTDWTTDDPDDWTVSGESGTDPEVSEVGTGEGHGGTGSGFCNIYTSDGTYVDIYQAISTREGHFYQASITVDTVTTGAIVFEEIGGDFNETISGAGTFISYFEADGASSTIRVKRSSGATDVTFDDITVKEITLPGGVEPGPYTKTTGSALPIPAEARIEIVGHNGSNPTYNASGDKKWLLMEPEACNECLYSREFDESVWTLSGTGSRTQNEKGIDGVSNIAWTLTDSDGAVLVRDQQSISIVSGTDAYTVSAFIKKTVGASTFPVLGVRILNGTTEIESYIILNTNSGATAEASAVGGGADAYGAISYGANWWRVWIIVDDNNTGNDLFHIWLCPAGSDDGSTIDVSLTGSVVFDQIDMRFVQRWVDSPIPTTTSSVCRATDAENPYWGSISGLFDATGTLVARWRPGFNEDDVSSDSAIFSVQDNAVSIAYHDASTNGLASNDGTTNATVSLDFSAFDDYRLAVKWGYDSGPEHFRIGADLFSNAFGSGDWGTEQSFDSAYAEGSYLKIGYDIIAPFHIQFIRIFNKILSDSQIDEL